MKNIFNSSSKLDILYAFNEFNFILLSSAVTFRRDKAISFNRITMIVLLYSSILGYETYLLLPIQSGIGIYGGLYQVSSLTQTFVVFISILSIIILQLSFFIIDIENIKENIMLIKISIIIKCLIS